MNIVVCVKHVPDATADRKFESDNTVDRVGVDGLLSELDEYAIEQARQIKEKASQNDGGEVEVTALCVGPEQALDAVRKALQMGADKGVHVSDEAIAGSDSVATSLVLAEAIKKIGSVDGGPDLIVCGMASTDGSMSVVPAMLAERLGLPQVTMASVVETQSDQIRVKRDGDTATEVIGATLPVVLSVTDQTGEARYPSFKGIMAAKKKPMETYALSDLGVEAEKVGLSVAWSQVEDTRAWGPPWTENSSSYFHAANRTKSSIELDLDSPDDVEVAQRLARRADVLIENFKDGSLARRGLGYEQLRTEAPGLVYVSVTGFGSAGGADLPGYDFLVQAVGGLMSITGLFDGEPTKVGVALVDVLASKDAVIGALAALRERESSGRGQRVEINLLSSLLGSLVNQASSYLATGTDPVALGNQHPSIAPYETLRAADGHLALCIGDDAQFMRLAIALSRPELAADDRFRTNSDRVRQRGDLTDLLEAALASDTVASWTERLTAVGLPAGKVASVGEAITLARRLGLDPTVPVADAPDQIRSPITLSDTPLDRYRPPPRLGEHNDEVRLWLMEEST